MGQLNELQIKAAQPRENEYMLADGEGLYWAAAGFIDTFVRWKKKLEDVESSTTQRERRHSTVGYVSPIDFEKAQKA